MEMRRTVESKAFFFPVSTRKDAFTDDVLDQVLWICSMDLLDSKIKFVCHIDREATNIELILKD